MSVAPCMTDIDLQACADGSQEESYATAPLTAFPVLFQQPDEEELYTSFEAAISDRLLALHNRWSRLSDPALLMSSRPRYHYAGTSFMTTPLPPVSPLSTTRPMRRWRQRLLYASLALLFTLLGFDLMGLLILLSAHS